MRKTTLAIALGLEAVHAGYRVDYLTAADLSQASPRPRYAVACKPPLRRWTLRRLAVAYNRECLLKRYDPSHQIIR